MMCVFIVISVQEHVHPNMNIWYLNLLVEESLILIAQIVSCSSIIIILIVTCGNVYRTRLSYMYIHVHCTRVGVKHLRLKFKASLSTN